MSIQDLILTDGVPWNEGGEDSRNFVKSFTEVLKTCSLTGRSKLILRQRFLTCTKYKSKHKITNILHNSSNNSYNRIYNNTCPINLR